MVIGGLILIAAIAIYLFGTPLLILVTLKNQADPEVQVIDPATLPLPDSFARQIDGLEQLFQQLGFQPRETMFLPHHTENVKALLKLYVHPEARDSAVAVTMLGCLNEQWSEQSQHVEFNSRFENGIEIDTGNSSEINVFKSPSESIKTQLPWIGDAAKLYRIHHAIGTAKFPGKEKVLRVDSQFGGDGAAFIADALRQELASAAKAGYLRLVQADDVYCPTVKGAYLMTWQLLPPMKWMVLGWRKRQVSRLLDQVGIN